jgi:enamine deaminase RidA (YjgF/YER057c/UK114 family)
MQRINRRLRDLGIELPAAAARGAQVALVPAGSLVFLGAQRAEWNGARRFVGKLGREYGVAEGREAARLCALNLLAQLSLAVGGDLDRVVRCVRLAGYVNCTPEFRSQREVVDAAGDLFLELFGDGARQVRLAVGVSSLPDDTAVEVEAAFETRRPFPWIGVRGLA